jgi:hypothetical protein
MFLVTFLLVGPFLAIAMILFAARPVPPMRMSPLFRKRS